VNFQHPEFRSSLAVFFKQEPGVYDDWRLQSYANQWTFLGKLPEDMRRLEYDDFWKPSDLAERIATGRNPYEAYL
jgi:hypothetical protein